MSAEAAVRMVRSNHRVFAQGSAATPLTLLRALIARTGDVAQVELVSISTLCDIGLNDPGVKESFFINDRCSCAVR